MNYVLFFYLGFEKLKLIDRRVLWRKRLEHRGLFHANERCNDFELTSVAKNIEDHITRYFPKAAVLLVDPYSVEFS